MREVCWIQEAGELKQYCFAIAALMNKKGCRVRFVTKLLQTQQQAESGGFDSVFMAPDGFHGRTFSDAELTALDEKYGPPGVHAIACSSAQMSWLHLSLEERLQVVARNYAFWERYFDEHPTGYVIFKNSGPVETRTVYNVARHRQIPYAQYCIGTTGGTFTLNDVEEDFCWSELLEAIASGPRTLAPHERKRVDETVAEASRRPQQRLTANVRWASQKLGAFVGRVRQLVKWTDWRKNPLQVAATIRYGELFWQQSNWRWSTSRRFPYEQPTDEKFVYFPLFHTGETTTLARSPHWARHVPSLIRLVAESLPWGHKVYVKEHPIHLGQQSLKELQELAAIPRVKVISHDIPGRWLIQDCQALVTLEGTSGWEAFLNRKPVVALGRRFYTYSDLIYRVDNVNNLEKILWQALAEGSTHYVEHSREWLWFIWCAISTCLPGSFLPVDYPYTPGTDLSNLETVAEGICAKIQRDIEAQPRSSYA